MANSANENLVSKSKSISLIPWIVLESFCSESAILTTFLVRVNFFFLGGGDSIEIVYTALGAPWQWFPCLGYT